MDPWGAIIAVLIAIRDSDLALPTFSAAGLVIPARADGAHIERIRSYVAAAQRTYEQLGAAEQQRVVVNMVLFLRNDLPRRQNAESLRQLEEILQNLGWRVIDDTLVQLTLVDPGEFGSCATGSSCRTSPRGCPRTTRSVRCHHGRLRCS
jgi:hypothetical protein